MKIAVTYVDGQIFQHFGHTEKFKIYEIKEGEIENTQVVDTNGSGHGALASFLMKNGVDTRALQEVLGHSNLNTTQIYTHLDNASLHEAAMANPIGRKTKSDIENEQ